MIMKAYFSTNQLKLKSMTVQQEVSHSLLGRTLTDTIVSESSLSLSSKEKHIQTTSGYQSPTLDVPATEICVQVNLHTCT